MVKPRLKDIGFLHSWPIEVTSAGREKFGFEYIGLVDEEPGNRIANARFRALHFEDEIPESSFKKKKYRNLIESALKSAKAKLKEQGKEWGSECGRKRDTSQKVIRSRNACIYIDTPRIVVRTPKKNKKSDTAPESSSPQEVENDNDDDEDEDDEDDDEIEDVDQEDEEIGDIDQEDEEVVQRNEELLNGENNRLVVDNATVSIEGGILGNDTEIVSDMEGTESGNGHNKRKRAAQDEETAPENKNKRQRASTPIVEAPKVGMIEGGDMSSKKKFINNGAVIAQEQVEIQMEEQKQPNQHVQQKEKQAAEAKEDDDDCIEEEHEIKPNTSISSIRGFINTCSSYWPWGKK